MSANDGRSVYFPPIFGPGHSPERQAAERIAAELFRQRIGGLVRLPTTHLLTANNLADEDIEPCNSVSFEIIRHGQIVRGVVCARPLGLFSIYAKVGIRMTRTQFDLPDEKSVLNFFEDGFKSC